MLPIGVTTELTRRVLSGTICPNAGLEAMGKHRQRLQTSQEGRAFRIMGYIIADKWQQW